MSLLPRDHLPLYFTVQPHFPVLSPVSDQTSACSSKCGVGRCKDVTTGDIPCKCTTGLPWGDRHPVHPFAIRPTNAWWFQYQWHVNSGKGPFDKVIEVGMPWIATSTSPTVNIYMYIQYGFEENINREVIYDSNKEV